MSKKAVIIGGGFAGVKTALELVKHTNDNKDKLEITLISDRDHFEYYPALYRVVTGNSPLEVLIPLSKIFKETNLALVKDKITGIDVQGRLVCGTDSYEYDYLVVALGSEINYFNIEGLEKYSFGFKSVHQALQLRQHIHDVVDACLNSEDMSNIPKLHFVLVGGGTSGVELAGELIDYVKKLAKAHNVDPSLVAVDLIERADRILPYFPEEISEIATKKLRSLGVNIYLNRALQKAHLEDIYLQDIKIKAKTLIWTAGVTTNHLIKNTKGLKLNQRGKVQVNEYLQAEGLKHVYIAGDCAATKYSGMGQTALDNGAIIAENIANDLKHAPLRPYSDVKPKYAIPVGPYWAIAVIGKLKLAGKLGWFIRRAADYRFLLSILSPIALIPIITANHEKVEELAIHTHLNSEN